MKRLIILLILAAFAVTGLQAQTKNIAHRGYWDTPQSAQNSIVALYKAHELGLYGAEFDVLITADSVPVVNHDDKIEGKLIEATPYALLRDIHLKNGEVLPTLEQYLVHGKACSDTQLILEIKPHQTKETEDRAVRMITAMVDAYQLRDQVEYISFSLNICQELKRLRPNCIVSYLKGDKSPQEIKEIGLSGIDYHHKVFSDNKDWIKQAQELGLLVNVWTVNDAAMMQHLIDQKVDFITTDKPAVLKDLLEKKK